MTSLSIYGELSLELPEATRNEYPSSPSPELCITAPSHPIHTNCALDYCQQYNNSIGGEEHLIGFIRWYNWSYIFRAFHGEGNGCSSCGALTMVTATRHTLCVLGYCRQYKGNISHCMRLHTLQPSVGGKCWEGINVVCCIVHKLSFTPYKNVVNSIHLLWTFWYWKYLFTQSDHWAACVSIASLVKMSLLCILVRIPFLILNVVFVVLDLP